MVEFTVSCDQVEGLSVEVICKDAIPAFSFLGYDDKNHVGLGE
jgi:hypothetical protein